MSTFLLPFGSRFGELSTGLFPLDCLLILHIFLLSLSLCVVIYIGFTVALPSDIPLRFILAGIDDRSRFAHLHSPLIGYSRNGRPLVPKSSYYFGPPGPDSAYGTPPVGQIGVHHPREILRIERDYTGGEVIQFAPIYPLELENRVSCYVSLT